MAIRRPHDAKLPLFLNEKVAEECQRWIERAGPDHYAGPDSIGLHDVLRAHFLIVEFFIEGDATEPVGTIGPKDLNLLHSALSRQAVGFESKRKWPDRFDRLATVFYGLIKNHPFHDANKRTALLTALHQLNRFGRCSRVEKREWEDLAVRVAADELRRYAAFRSAEKRIDAEVLFIGRFFRSKTRKIEKTHYLITYRQLERILRDYGFRFGSPNGNHIDIVQDVERRRGLLSKREIVTQKICQIGFPDWNAEVTRPAMSTIRRECRLTDEQGIDSLTFYKGVEPMHVLIAEYAGALRRLADR